MLALAESAAQRDKFADDMQALASLARQKDEAGTSVLTILSSARFGLSDRKKLLAVLARRAGVDSVVLRFLDYVLEQDRGAGLLEITRAYQRMADAAANRVQARIVSATPLRPEQVESMQRALQAATGKTVVTTTATDPELIGGVLVQLGSFVIDGSVRQSLARVRETLRS